MRLGSRSSLDTSLVQLGALHAQLDQLDRLEQSRVESRELAPKTVQKLVSGFWVARALFAVVKLGIADLLSEGPRKSEDIAYEIDAHEPSLYRALRALADVGVFSEDANGYFGLTPVSHCLRSDAFGSLRSFVLAELGEPQFRAWEDILYSIKTGKPVRTQPVFSDFAQDHESGDTDMPFIEYGLGSLAAQVQAAVLRAYDFSRVGTICDIGGGDGTFLAFLLQAHESLRGILLDRPRMIEHARRRLSAEGVAKRCRVIAGDFFTSMPGGGDVYTLKWILRDYGDEQARLILENCYRTMSPHTKLLLIEAVVPPGNIPSFHKLQDLGRLVAFEGRERTEAEFRSLLRKAGLRLKQILPACAEASIIEAVRE
jgi:hypothetical protein